MVSVKVHNVLDYVIGAVLVSCPYIFGFSGIDAGRNLFLALGVGLVFYSLATNYPYSIFKWIPLGAHMTLDVVAGVMLILGSYLFGYRDLLTDSQIASHYVLGAGAILLVALTRPKTDQGMRMENRDSGNSPIDIKRRAA